MFTENVKKKNVASFIYFFNLCNNFHVYNCWKIVTPFSPLNLDQPCKVILQLPFLLINLCDISYYVFTVRLLCVRMSV